jgi:ribosome-associated toxin RatA of RatAB toxin-antitoxin module
VKEITGHASAVVAAPVEECFALLEAVDRYPTWNRDLVREVDVLQQTTDGRPATARARIHVAQSPFGKNFEFVVAVHSEPMTAVQLTRLPSSPSDREGLSIGWRMRPEAGTEIALEFRATTSLLPSLLPLFGVGDMIAGTLLGAATRVLNAPSAAGSA